MTKKSMKIALLLIAAVMLVSIAFAGAASAGDTIEITNKTGTYEINATNAIVYGDDPAKDGTVTYSEDAEGLPVLTLNKFTASNATREIIKVRGDLYKTTIVLNGESNLTGYSKFESDGGGVISVYSPGEYVKNLELTGKDNDDSLTIQNIADDGSGLVVSEDLQITNVSVNISAKYRGIDVYGTILLRNMSNVNVDIKGDNSDSALCARQSIEITASKVCATTDGATAIMKDTGRPGGLLISENANVTAISRKDANPPAGIFVAGTIMIEDCEMLKTIGYTYALGGLQDSLYFDNLANGYNFTIQRESTPEETISYADFMNADNWMLIFGDLYNCTNYPSLLITKKKSQLTLDPMGGQSTTSTVTIPYNCTSFWFSTPIDPPVKEGYDFAGWYNESTGGVKVIEPTGKFASDVPGYTNGEFWRNTSEQVTLYAHWNPKPYGIIITNATGTYPLTTDLTKVYGDYAGAANGTAELSTDSDGTLILTLDNFKATNTTGKKNILQIICGGTNVTIKLTGTSTLTTRFAADSGAALNVNGKTTSPINLTITNQDGASGKLVLNNTVNNVTTTPDVHAIHLNNGYLRITGQVEIEAVADNSLGKAYGIKTNVLEIDSGAAVNVSATSANKNAYALYSRSEWIKIDGPTTVVTAYANASKNSAHAIYIGEKKDVPSPLVISSATVTATAEGDIAYGVYSGLKGGVLISGTSAVVTINANGAKRGFGMYVRNGELDDPSSFGSCISIPDCSRVAVTGTADSAENMSSIVVRNMEDLQISDLESGYQFSSATSATGPTSYADFVNPDNWREYQPHQEYEVIFNASAFSSVKIEKKSSPSPTPYTPSHRESGQTVIQQQVPVQDVSVDPTPANQATADISASYKSQSVLGTSASDTAALKEQYPEAAAQVELSFALAMEAGIPLTNSKGAKAVVVTAENIPNVEKVTFSRVYEISPANAGEKLTKVTVKVPKSDITSKGLTSDDVTVYHYLESYNIWVPLETLSVSSDADNYYYTAATDGTSPFGVLVKKIGSETTTPTTTQTQKSPAPFVGIIAGLGAAALFLRLRR